MAWCSYQLSQKNLSNESHATEGIYSDHKHIWNSTMSGTLTTRDSPPPKAWPLSLSSAGVPGSEAATSLSAPPVALPQQQTREHRKVSLIKTVRIVRKHHKAITFQGSEDKQRFNNTNNRISRVLNASSRDAVMHTCTAFSFPLNVQQAHSTIWQLACPSLTLLHKTTYNAALSTTPICEPVSTYCSSVYRS